MSKNIMELRNLGPSSAKALSSIGVSNLKELETKGAIEDKHWTKYKSQKGALLIELENNKELKNLFSDND